MIDWLLILTVVLAAAAWVLYELDNKISTLQRRLARLEQAEGKGIQWRTGSTEGKNDAV